MSRTLYNLTQDMAVLMDMLLDPDIDPEELADTIEGVLGEMEVKADGYGAVITELESRAAALRAEEKRMAAERLRLERHVDRMKAALLDAMKAANKTKLEGDLFRFAIQKNGGALPVILDVEPEKLPDGFKTITVVADKKAITEYLKKASEAGELVDWAHFGERGESLRMR